jgi:ankyrin repeat protein
VLIDGMDEVSPHYTEEVIQVLKILSKTKIKRIWVMSRNSVKDRLETEFQCPSYSMVPFSEEDQKRFLVKFWNKTCPEKKDYLQNLANRVVKLSTEHLTVQDKQFMGIPLQSLLLAEMFEGNLKQCTTAGTVELPEHINVVMLYYLYVEKKWDIYLSEKKKSDRTTVYALTDDDALHKIFIQNHMAAALVAILSTQQLEKLTDKTIVEGVREFLQKITEGIEKTGIITDVIEGRPVFQHRTLAEYFVARWLCDNFQTNQTFMMDHLFESGFGVVRSMVDRILADKYPLHEAVLNSDMRHVAMLLERKESITQKDRGGRKPLHVAVRCRMPEIIRLLLEHGADVSSVDTFLGLSPVEYATRMADWQVLSLLMEKWPDIREQVLHEMNSVCTENIFSALRAAARYGHTGLLRYLIRRENCVNVVFPGDSGTLLHEAARGNHIQTARTLVDLGANCDIQNAYGKTALHVSAEMGNLEVAKFIVERQEMSSGEDEMKYIPARDTPITKLNLLTVHDKDDNTPLHLAAAAGNTSTVLYFLSVGSEVRSCNTRGEYPLTLAARYGRNDTVKLLLQSCCAVKCEEIMTSALRAAIVAGQVDTTALLLRSGESVMGGENEKPIHLASRMGHKEIVSLLLQYGASLTSRTETGNTALHFASEAGHLSLVKYLVELDRKGMNTLNYEDETPLHLAARNGRDYLVTYFAENGCNINAAAANGATCLHVACENGHYTTVKCLLRHGAEVNAMNSADQTPLHIAACWGQTKIVELLFLHNANLSLRDKEA